MTDMEQQREARKKALRLLEHMDRTEKGLTDRLLRAGFSEELETPDERALLCQMIEKKYEPGAELDEREMRRLYGYLARRGFRSGDIFSVLEEMDITQIKT